jgi:hypothetical protein
MMLQKKEFNHYNNQESSGETEELWQPQAGSILQRFRPAGELRASISFNMPLCVFIEDGEVCIGVADGCKSGFNAGSPFTIDDESLTGPVDEDEKVTWRVHISTSELRGIIDGDQTGVTEVVNLNYQDPNLVKDSSITAPVMPKKLYIVIIVESKSWKRVDWTIINLIHGSIANREVK